ncbi:MAG: hypothetical protein K2K35_02720 [Lachnospiraceae bacterium]|nr:hypothetical protein [Lachnospiraceae bacterium]
MQKKFEYIKCYWKYIDDETPVILFYEVDLENGRYATRMTEIFNNRKSIPVDDGFEFVTEAPVPEIGTINQEKEFYAQIITKEEFELVYNCIFYTGNIDFPV